MVAKLQYKIDKNKSNCTKWKIFHLRTARNGKFLARELHEMENLQCLVYALTSMLYAL